MTVTITFLTPEGAVLGSDSTTTVSIPGPHGPQVAQLFNSAQKVFEVGPRLEHFMAGQDFAGAVSLCGDGGFGPVSWRNFISEFYCRIIQTAGDLSNVPELFLNFAKQKWSELQSLGLIDSADPLPDAGLGVAAIHKDSHEVHAGCISIAGDSVERLQVGDIRIGGDPSGFTRVVEGCDRRLVDALYAAGVDMGTFQTCAQNFDISGFVGQMPLRDAIDFVHFVIYSTIKLNRYQGGPASVGGPIEIATITADRGFRWVMHKPLKESIGIPRGEYAHEN